MRVSIVKRVNLIGALIDCQSRHNNFVCLNILQKWEDSDYRMARFTDREKEVLSTCAVSFGSLTCRTTTLATNMHLYSLLFYN